jgi:hypothetical protein
VSRAADSFSSGHTKSFPLTINAGSPASGYAYDFTSATDYSGTVIYRETGGTRGCSFTVVASYNSGTGKWTFTFSSSPQGGIAASSCNLTASRDVNTGSFNAFPVISGFYRSRQAPRRNRMRPKS